MSDSFLQNANHKNLLLLIWLRALAIISQMATIFFVNYIMKIELPMQQMTSVVLALLILNFVSFLRYKLPQEISNELLFFELLFDVFALTAQLYFSGGASNPFISLFLLQVILAAILLRATYAWLVGAITIFCYIWLGFYGQELHGFHHHNSGDFFNLHLHGMLISYILTTLLLLVFVNKIIKNLRQKEVLANMGLLASSAAHELGTPLSTISVIVSDWKNLPLEQEMLQDVNIVESQLTRCKKIISAILFSSGKSRAENAQIAPVKNVFDNLITDWKSSRQPQNLNYIFNGNALAKIIFDDVLTQAFFNIFDNALEASPNFVEINATANSKQLEISIVDNGKGFSQEVLKLLGQPNLSTKNSSGMGLFLALNIFKRIGGNLKIFNLENGAKVEITLPL